MDYTNPVSIRYDGIFFEWIKYIYKYFDITIIVYRSPTKIPNRDKKTESPYLVHPLTYRQVYLTKDAYFVEKIHCELVKWL